MYQLSIFEEKTYSYWTPEQEKVFHFVEFGEGNAVLDAVAGSGKTSTIIEAAMRLKQAGLVKGKKGTGLFVAFNKSIASELEERLKGTKFKAKTLNSLGYGILRKTWFRHQWQIDSKKYSRIVQDIGKKEGVFTKENSFKEIEDFVQVVNFIRKTNTPVFIPEIMEMAKLFKLNISQYFKEEHYHNTYKYIYLALSTGLELVEERGIIDFTDQVYAPLFYHLQSKTKYDFIFIDEAQDLSRSQAELLRAFCHNDTRLFFVGDRRQSIYLFNGATPNSMSLLQEEYKARSLSLNTCFRCPSEHIRLAQQYNPSIQSPPRHKPGLIHIPDGKEELSDIFPSIFYSQKPFLILSRFNAPIIKLCHKLNFQYSIRAKVRGRDIIPSLINLLWRIFPSGRIPLIGTALASIAQYRSEYLSDTKEKDVSPDLLDKFHSLEAIVNAYRPTNIKKLEEDLGLLFGEDNEPLIQLSSIHRAKGLECENVIVLGYSRLPYEHTKHSGLEEEQEENLTYVAYTRSTYNLYLIATTDLC